MPTETCKLSIRACTLSTAPTARPTRPLRPAATTSGMKSGRVPALLRRPPSCARSAPPFLRRASSMEPTRAAQPQPRDRVYASTAISAVPSRRPHRIRPAASRMRTTASRPIRSTGRRSRTSSRSTIPRAARRPSSRFRPPWRAMPATSAATASRTEASIPAADRFPSPTTTTRTTSRGTTRDSGPPWSPVLTTDALMARTTGLTRAARASGSGMPVRHPSQVRWNPPPLPSIHSPAV